MLPFRIGRPNNGGPIVTASGLIFIVATTDNLIRAFDIETGEEIWKDELPARGRETPKGELPPDRWTDFGVN